MDSGQIINILALVTLFEMMVTIGLGVTTADVTGVARDWRLMMRAGFANYIAVPAVTLGLLLLLRPSPLVAVGFLVAAVCPGAPYAPPLTTLAKGKTAVAVGLMVVLAASSAVLAPLLLRALLPLVSSDRTLRVDTVKMITALALGQLLPLGVGLYLRERRPTLASRLLNPARRLSLMLNVALIAVVLFIQFRMLAEVRLIGYLGMLALVLASVIAGWLLAFPGPTELRKTLAVTTAVRNAGVTLVIVSGSFPSTPAVTAATVYALFQTMVMVLIALGLRRCS